MAQIIAAEGSLDDRSLEKYLARLDPFNERDDNDVGWLNDVIISHRLRSSPSTFAPINEQPEKKETPESFCILYCG